MAQDIPRKNEAGGKINSEKLFRALIEKNADMMTLALPAGELLYVSPSLTNVLGFTEEEYRSRPAFEFIHPDDLPGLMEQIAGILDTPGKSFYRKQRLLHKNGTYRWCEGTITNMLQDPDIGALVSNFRDITRQEQDRLMISASENRFRLIIEQFPHPVVTYAPDGTYTNANKAWEIMWQDSRDNIRGYNIRKDEQLIASGLSQYVEKAFAGEVAVSEPYLYDPALIGQIGRKRWMQMTLYPLKDDNGEILEVILVLQDVTENKVIEEELEQKVKDRTAALESQMQRLAENDEKFQKAFQASAAGITITRLSDSVYVEVNDAFALMTGHAKEALLGHTSRELDIIVDIGRREEVLQMIREHGWAKDFEMTIRHKSGRIVEILSSVETIMLNNEKYAINVIYDITERKKSEQQLDAVNKELEAFSYSVSHDLRAPLRAIDGYAKIFEQDYRTRFDDEGLRLLKVIQKNARKMGNLIDDLLAFSRLGKKSVQKANINMNDMFEAVLSDIKATTGHKAEIILHKLDDATGDYSLIQQVVVNLVSNAIKYSSKKEYPVVEISSVKEKGAVTYIVKDNGEGFEIKYVHKLFGVFQRLHTNDEFEGTGVGLAIVQRIIDKHGGQIEVDAVVGEGATFSFTLPE